MDNYLVEVCVSKDLTIFPCGVFEGSSCWFAEGFFFFFNVLKLGVFQACLEGSFEESLSVLNYTQQKGSERCSCTCVTMLSRKLRVRQEMWPS